MNTTSFSPFTITAKEQVSPTAFVLSVRAGDTFSPSSNGGGGSKLLNEAWKHGLWSVEVKQPQLQIARHYTPLPPPPSSPNSAAAEEDGELLRFLVRKVDGGEMSTYLSKLRVGEKIWLRGPHLGFDVARRLGDAKNVVFLAGGTGIAPALQVARRLLEDGVPNSSSDATSTSSAAGARNGPQNEKPTISILWANRRTADALGRQSQCLPNPSTGKSSWFSGWWHTNTLSTAPPKQPEADTQESSLAQQIRTLQQKHSGHFRIDYFVDEERRFINDQDVRAALTSTTSSSASASAQPLLPISPSCPWHAHVALESLPDDNDAGRRNLGCVCARQSASNGGTGSAESELTGANLVCVSGPDGFVAALAGPKRWHGGGEMQGPLGGVLGRLIEGGGVGGNWLVLKL